jgi:hypothetical protein
MEISRGAAWRLEERFGRQKSRCSRLIRLYFPQSAVTLHKYWVGRSCPSRSRNLYKSHVKIQLLSQIRLQELVRPSSAPVRPVWHRASSRQDHNSLIQTPNWTYKYAFRSSRWDLFNGEVKLEFWAHWMDWSDRCGWKVRPVRTAEFAKWPPRHTNHMRQLWLWLYDLHEFLDHLGKGFIFVTWTHDWTSYWRCSKCLLVPFNKIISRIPKMSLLSYKMHI